MISFVDAQDSVKIRLACSKDLLLTILSSNIVILSNGYIKSDKYFFFYKSRCGKCSPKNNLFIKNNACQATSNRTMDPGTEKPGP